MNGSKKYPNLTGSKSDRARTLTQELTHQPVYLRVLIESCHPLASEGGYRIVAFSQFFSFVLRIYDLLVNLRPTDPCHFLTQSSSYFSSLFKSSFPSVPPS
jgi:hypothetical protein